ncbi:hypothetical protein IWW34DRAFT_893038 [Fusarium oxysporum f. sp. albedinis]|uniref:Uncharacterized protein n=2 Tax=Fusarium oxysporum f. sp. conglutinans TaxID=100902 RepID=F9FIW9_FUSOF|nr:hypothetical protein FOXB_06348 [Fusarium oxysporum f. sp. conglutinans Fo5176]EXL65632.1 hypothetical protein FOPG_18148 [Fusarium oxysporum f. sp. conglutinans race 2 54008]KAG7001749.1 hypothetical protein FocnCong_v011341 [Fusarium oxysporum f. sp. conglutinans]KAI3565929.1 hypothetical protein IWW34DRAFT_874780 [Fusarium oxysporum f. sp. albedinis]KAI8396488.1 hypothetical protein FOFC_21036 [Fusarium oxysporum]
MEPYLLGPDGLKVMPEIFGQGGLLNGTVIGPGSIDYGKVVRRKGKKTVISFGSDQCIEKPGQPDYFFANETGAMMFLYIPDGFASVLSDRAGYFRLAIWSVGEEPSCVAALKVTHNKPNRENSIEWGHSRLTYNVQPEEVSSRDSNTSTEHQIVKVEPNQRKIIAIAGLRKETFDHTLFQSVGGCYVWIHNGEIERSATCLSDEVSAAFDIEESLMALENSRRWAEYYKAPYGP